MGSVEIVRPYEAQRSAVPVPVVTARRLLPHWADLWRIDWKCRIAMGLLMFAAVMDRLSQWLAP